MEDLDVSMEGEGEGERITGILYLLTNSVDNKKYVGSTQKNKYARLGEHFVQAHKPININNKHYIHMRKIL